MTGVTTQHQGCRIAVEKKPHLADVHAEHLLKTIRDYLCLDVQAVKIRSLYTIEKALGDTELNNIALGPLVDVVTETATVDPSYDKEWDWTIEVGFKHGMTDNAGMTAQLTIEDFLGTHFSPGETVRAATQYLIKGNITHEDAQRIGNDLLGNVLIEEITIHKNGNVETIAIAVDDDKLMQISKERQLALNLEEMQAIRAYYTDPSTEAFRAAHDLPSEPTDVELEALAQTWSEHCKHKIFNARITYTEGSKTEIVNSIFKSYIKKATDAIATGIDWLVSVFSDNAGIIRFTDTHNLAFKVETHNSPSALDPYGGALTGILGVNRDILGAGSGARLLANTDIFCFAPPNYSKPLPERLLHPKRIFEGVRRGVEHGGNKSGVPTVNGAIVFDERYLGKPLVYCGTAGIIPTTINDQPSHIKEILPGDLIVIAGGRTGKDGIHGATFSSEEFHAGSPSSAVQIGDPFTQKKLHDFLLDARDAGLYRTLTDNGAGGFSSSIGELAELSNGCEVHLDYAPLKNPQLLPWEIFLSESQERMTLAVPPEYLHTIEAIAAIHEVEITTIGTFTDSGNLHVLHQGNTVALLPLTFLHEGLPQLNLEAVWTAPDEKPVLLPPIADYSKEIADILSRYNVCSKESVIRQYDHEIQGGSTIKPLMGATNDGPMDAAVIRPLECFETGEGVVISNGICPKFSDIDTYHMTASAIDEAVRNAVAVGGNPDYLAVLDNFCWPDPVYHPEKTPDGKHKLAQLVRANKALYDYCIAYGTPIISGKDSMKNDYKIGNTKISVPPTLLISAIGKIDNVELAVSGDVKCAGDLVYIVGMTYNELGSSEFASHHALNGGYVPKVNAVVAKKLYDKIHIAMKQRLIASCHDCSDGGIAIAIAETAVAGGLGVAVDLAAIPHHGCNHDAELLFSESNSRFVITIAPENRDACEQLLAGLPYACIGTVRDDNLLQIIGTSGELIVNETLDYFKTAWQGTLGATQ